MIGLLLIISFICLAIYLAKYLRHRDKKQLYKGPLITFSVLTAILFICGAFTSDLNPNSSVSKEEKQEQKNNKQGNNKDKIKKTNKNNDKEAEQDKLNAEYPDFSSKFPAGVNSSSNEQLSNVQMRFTGKIYGLGADSMGNYMVILKDGNGNLGYISYDHSKTGKITLDQQLTIYGSTNGKGHVRSQDVDDLGVPETGEGKSTVILNADKITKE